MTGHADVATNLGLRIVKTGPPMKSRTYAAQEIYAETGAYSELLSIYHLLGDPALRLQ